jgi:hypothetical protein
LYPQSRAHNPQLVAFRDWLVEIGEDTPP